MNIENLSSLSDLAEDRVLEARRVAVMNNKGGCGKSAITEALTYRLAERGNNVLVVDFDTQRNISQRFGVTDDAMYYDRRTDSLFKELDSPIFREKQIHQPVRIRSSLIDRYDGAICLYIGSNSTERAAEFALRSMGAVPFTQKFKQKMDFYSHYFDYIVYDTPPALDRSIPNELLASTVNDIIVPFDGCEAASGLTSFIEWINRSVPMGYSKPNALFAMTKYRDNTKVFRDSARADSNLRELFTMPQLEANNMTYQIMKAVFGDYVCDIGIKERQPLRDYTYDGLKNTYDMKKSYEKLVDEIIEKIHSPRDNIFDLWSEKNLSVKMAKYMRSFESKRHSGNLPEIEDVQFRNITKVKNSLGLK